MHRTKYWLLAIRPKTLSIALTPVICGTALAWAETGLFHWPAGLAALAAAMLLQIGTNLYNDALDFARGTDTPQRLGPRRATEQGWFSATQVKQAAHISFGLALLVGSYLVWYAGWPLLVVGLLSLLGGYCYTAGPRPIAYSASGELFVFIFFGLFAVLGSYYVQGGSLSIDALFTACAIGTMAAAVLLVNNYRDRETDARAGKLTLVHRLGERRSQLLYAILLSLPYALPLLLSNNDGSWLIALTLPLALVLLWRFVFWPVSPAFNQLLAQTAVLQLLYGLLLSISLLLW